MDIIPRDVPFHSIKCFLYAHYDYNLYWLSSPVFVMVMVLHTINLKKFFFSLFDISHKMYVVAGTGNGMVKSLLDSVGELCEPSNAVLAIIRG